MSIAEEMSEASDSKEFRAAPRQIRTIRFVGAALSALGCIMALGSGLGDRAVAWPFVFLLILGAVVASIGGWWLYLAQRLTGLRAKVGPTGLDVVGLPAKRIRPYRRVRWRQAFVPWSEIEGVVLTALPNPMLPEGVERTYVLYTSRGDFNFSELYWNDVDSFVEELTQRSGRPLDTVAAERQRDVATLSRSVRRTRRFLRAVGWASLLLGGLFGVVALLLLVQRGAPAATTIGAMVAVLVTGGTALVRRKV